jgi:radical S-adenosyl methionine domain-containing protein 2
MDKDLLSPIEWKEIIQLLRPYCQRINFAGGEPLLHKELLNELILFAHQEGLISTIITNGQYLDKKWLDEFGCYIKAIGISCDSSNEDTQKQLGRGNGEHVSSTLNSFRLINDYNLSGGSILMKLNTVVNKLNCKEDMTEFVLKSGAKRWKVFQLLDIIGENEKYSKDLIISKDEFEFFKRLNQKITDNDIDFVPENTSQLIDTYVMVNPEGRFFSNRNHMYKHSDPIHIVGVEKALSQIDFDQRNLQDINRMFL